ncbi:MAG: hypothetical protein Q4F71_13270, partial [Paracoccus sp. (in: a-proteobacteria)]|nr:hypothetical protein [Paracoccus sp. (in: a-proteobacteria)]
MNEQMKQGAPAPSAEYALGFDPERVMLLRRSGAVWEELGDARFDGADLHGDLAALKDRIASDSPAGHVLRLVIPDDQILYTQLSLAPAPSRIQALRNALDGLTPYRVADLAFDWQDLTGGSPDAPEGTVRVAAVARQTLREAEEFALRHGFEPESFVAAPANDDFPRPPSFGQTRSAGAREQQGFGAG